MDDEHAPAMPAELTEIRLRLEAALAGAVNGQSAAAVAAGVAAYELARLDGLCHDGAWECAQEAARRALAGKAIDKR
ncbi:hypothetical protein EO238_27450 [Citrobacter sp. AAK_AS5]|nr:hypothetical protein EO238_27450 [Citrobacter sp. AAK_AS5]